MRDALRHSRRVPLNQARNLILVDTCFLIYAIEHKKIDELLKIDNVAVTSFNIEELTYVEKNLAHHLKKGIRELLKDKQLKVVDIPVSPGDREGEVKFVESIEPKLIEIMHDNSDAVLAAVAVKTHSIILTRDRHHIFTAMLENLVDDYDIRIVKDLHEL